MKKTILLIVIIIIALVILSKYFLFNNSQIKEINIDKIISELVNKGVIDLDDVNDQKAQIIASLIDSKTQSKITFVEIPEWSGTGGAKAFIVSSDLSGNNINLIGDFFGSKNKLNKTLISRGGIIYYTEMQNFSSSSYLSIEVQLDLKNPSRNLKLSSPDSLESYVTRNNIKPGTSPSELSESLQDYKWIDDKTVELKRVISDQANNNFPIETWQYNLDSKEYKLIGAK